MAESDSTELTQDVVFDVLSSPRRRFIIYTLQDESEPYDLRELADEVAAWENETPVEELTSAQRKRVYVSLYQTHIPKLEELGIIDYDSESGIVQSADQRDEVGRYLSADEADRSWGLYYLALAIASAAVVLGVALDLSVLAAVPELVTAAIVIGAFAVMAIAHRLSIRRTNRHAIRDLIE